MSSGSCSLQFIPVGYGERVGLSEGVKLVHFVRLAALLKCAHVDEFSSHSRKLTVRAM
jgi:hypothetical protein